MAAFRRDPGVASGIFQRTRACIVVALVEQHRSSAYLRASVCVSCFVKLQTSRLPPAAGMSISRST